MRNARMRFSRFEQRGRLKQQIQFQTAKISKWKDINKKLNQLSPVIFNLLKIKHKFKHQIHSKPNKHPEQVGVRILAKSRNVKLFDREIHYLSFNKS